MAEVADLLVLSLVETDGGDGEDDEDHHSETLDHDHHCFAPVANIPSDLSRQPQIGADFIESGHYRPGSELPEDQIAIFPEPCEFPCFRVPEVAELSQDDMGLALGLGSQPAFQIQEGEGDDGAARVMVSEWEADEFFLGWRSSASESVESGLSGLRIVEFDSDSDSEEQIVAVGGDSDSITAPDQAARELLDGLCIDANEEFEWEEVEEADGCLEEREVLSMMAVAEEAAASALTGLRREYEEEAARNVEWEVLAESYFGDDHDGFVYTSEYDILVGQFLEHDSLKGTPPAAKSVVENLPSVALTGEDIANKNTNCAVCKDDIPIHERVKKLPCSHYYHEECILPWLGIRNTCPLCRFELPTDDPEYERWKAQRASNEVSEEEARLRYEFEILPEA